MPDTCERNKEKNHVVFSILIVCILFKYIYVLYWQEVIRNSDDRRAYSAMGLLLYKQFSWYLKAVIILCERKSSSMGSAPLCFFLCGFWASNTEELFSPYLGAV